ncbi:ACP S-malonyltransferase [Paenibacillus assamensis]|uniref:ACP S-malonyltransferase n=1 Tax=Paenibacillus assamensis TaxID=311244 RepID=UPI00041910AB|nr:ACP S-malonyltransferase [Paenibacillus assamensis]
MNKVAFLFSGQGSQYVRMGKTFFERYESVRRRFSEASEVLGFNISDLCFNGTSEVLTKTENTQPAILILSVAMFEVAVNEGLRPSYLAGHSLGELSALTAAGVFPFTDAVRLARIRGEAMASCSHDNKGGMIAVTNMEPSTIEIVLKELEKKGCDVKIANYNTPTQTILSGSTEGISFVEEHLRRLGANVIPLNVSGPFHSPYMMGAVNPMITALSEMNLGGMNIPVMNCHEGRLYTKDDDIRSVLAAQLTGAVRWTKVLTHLYSNGVTHWVEMGPKDVLKKLTLQTLSNVLVYAYDNEIDREAIKKELRLSVRSDKTVPDLVALCLGAAVSTRNTNWDEEAYQKGVVEPYKNIQILYELIMKEQRHSNEEEISKALTLLQRILVTKGVSQEECHKRIRMLLHKSNTDILLPEYGHLSIVK